MLPESILSSLFGIYSQDFGHYQRLPWQGGDVCVTPECATCPHRAQVQISYMMQAYAAGTYEAWFAAERDRQSRELWWPSAFTNWPRLRRFLCAVFWHRWEGGYSLSTKLRVCACGEREKYHEYVPGDEHGRWVSA